MIRRTCKIKNRPILVCTGLLLSVLFLIGCSSNPTENANQTPNETNAEGKLFPEHIDEDIDVIIEIPAGTLEKWEMDKTTTEIKLQEINGKPRIVDYLSYPANYGMVPETVLSHAQGGDGDPLDAIVLGTALERGSLVKCRILGVLYLIDRGENDFKLITTTENTPFYSLKGIQELNDKYPGVTEILEIWFKNYKGAGVAISNGYGERKEALEIYFKATREYLKQIQIDKKTSIEN